MEPIMYIYDPMYSESLDALKEDITRISDDVAQQLETIAETQAAIAEKTVEPYESGLVFGFIAALLVCIVWAVSFRP